MKVTANWVYRIGPIWLLLFIVAWSTVWGMAVHGENQSGIYNIPMLLAAGLVIAWHVSLILTESGWRRFAYIAYAIIHVPLFSWFFFVMFLVGSHQTL